VDDQELTPWQEINPTDSGRLPALRSGHSLTLAELRRSATPEQLQSELTACLALVGAVGMTEDARCEWFKAARITLEGIPSDLLAMGCRKARLVSDHPSKIVPAIMDEVRERWEYRFQMPPPVRGDPPPAKDLMACRGQPMTEDETTELNAMLERLGATARYRADGSRFMVGGEA